MALIIKAYNPSRCGDCDLCELYTDMMTDEYCYKCVVTTNVVDTEKKHYTCPIIGEIPDRHGDLIDRQAVLSYFETAFLMGADMDYEDILGIVSNPKAIPTIVEATE